MPRYLWLYQKQERFQKINTKLKPAPYRTRTKGQTGWHVKVGSMWKITNSLRFLRADVWIRSTNTYCEVESVWNLKPHAQKVPERCKPNKSQMF